MKTNKHQARAAKFSRYGGVDELEIVDIETPTPGPGEVLVEVLTAGINHIEGYLRLGQLADEFPVDFPQGQGSDFAGLVVAVGEGVTAFSRGSEVLGHATMASHASHIVVPEINLVAKPAALSWEVAGSLFLAGLAANDGVEAVHVGKGDTVVISAAAGGVGSMQAHLALGRGATVIGTCGELNFDYLRSIGVKPVYYGDGVADRIRELAPHGVNAFIDNYGNNLELAENLGVGLHRVRSSNDRRDIELRAIRPTPEDAAAHTRVLAKITELAALRTINVLISGFYPFDAIREAFGDLEQHHSRGKVVLGMRPVNSAFHGLGGRKVRFEQERSR